MKADEQLQSIFEFLADEGYGPKFLHDTAVRFTKGQLNFVVQQDPKHPNVLSLVCPRFWPLESPSEVLRAALAASDACKDTYVAKVYIVDDDVCAAAELLVGAGTRHQEILADAMTWVESAVECFVGAMNNDADEGDDGEHDSDDEQD
jgi:hypothetical protein